MVGIDLLEYMWKCCFVSVFSCCIVVGVVIKINCLNLLLKGWVILIGN